MSDTDSACARRRDEIEETMPETPATAPDAEEADVAGHSFPNFDYSRQVAHERAREADDYARKARLVRDARERPKK